VVTGAWGTSAETGARSSLSDHDRRHRDRMRC
jgi:hypothetical protein